MNFHNSIELLESVRHLIEGESHLLSDRMKIRAECILEHVEALLIGLETELEDEITRNSKR